VQRFLLWADTDQSNRRTRLGDFLVLTSIGGAGNGKGVGILLGDVDPLTVEVHVGHGFGNVRADRHAVGRQALFLTIVVDLEVARLVFDAYGHDDLLCMGW
jgi:hypothetical protein